MESLLILGKVGAHEPLGVAGFEIVQDGRGLRGPSWRMALEPQDNQAFSLFTYHLGMEVADWRHSTTVMTELGLRQAVERAAAQVGYRVLGSFRAEMHDIGDMANAAFAGRLRRGVRDGFVLEGSGGLV